MADQRCVGGLDIEKEVSPQWRFLRRHAPEAGRVLWLLSRRRERSPVAYTPVTDDGTQRSLAEKVDHIVVLVLENRSFDHMLGYLTIEGGRDDVDGLEPGLANEDEQGRRFGIEPMATPWLWKEQDPDHSGAGVAEQVNGGRMDGFIKNYARTLARRKVADPDVGVVMRYYRSGDLPVYDHLADQFTVCDRWFSSVPGATFPNRLYAAASRAAGRKDNDRPPVYDCPSFIRHLKEDQWRWYSYDPGTLRGIDGDYRLFHDRNYAPFEKRNPFEQKNFFDDVRRGALPAVAWIDPNFVDFNPFHGPPDSNDDHPPSDVRAGQELVLRLYDALRESPAWRKTLLVITYDEHGGFYDHVPPPPAPDDDPRFREYGVRVPALVVSPWVEARSVSHTLFDHTSIVKTILLRFCRRSDGAIPDLGRRVREAAHLGSLLSRSEAREAPPLPNRAKVIEQLASWRKEAYERWAGAETAAPRLRFEAQNEFSIGMLETAQKLRRVGLPPGQP